MKSIMLTALVLAMAGLIGFAAIFTPSAQAYGYLPPVIARWVGNAALDGVCVDKPEGGFLKGYAKPWAMAYLDYFDGRPTQLEHIMLPATHRKCVKHLAQIPDVQREALSAVVYRRGSDAEIGAWLKADAKRAKTDCAEAKQRGRGDLVKLCTKAFPGA